MSQYTIPEGFEWDETSGKYINTQILSDESGEKYRRIVSFDADSGEYTQQLLPLTEQPKQSRPLPPPLPEEYRNNMHIQNQQNKVLRKDLKASKSNRCKKESAKNKSKWIIPAIIGFSVLVIVLGVYLGYRKLKVDALGHGMMMSDEEVVDLLNMDSFEEHVESFNVYDGDFIEEGIVK